MFVTSADGTRIAFERSGSGHPVVVVGGAFMTAATASGIADALVEEGLCAVRYDRRARGASDDIPPYSPEREVEDLAAVIGAVGGRAALLGHSSGAILALLAASHGVGASALFLSEPPFGFGDGADQLALADRLQAMIADDRPEDTVSEFQRQAVGLPEEVVQQIRSSPMFADLVPLAQSVVYDARLTGECSTPTAAMREVDAPITILRGASTAPFLAAAVERLSEAIPRAELVVVDQSHNHDLHPGGTARAVRERLG